MSLTVSVPDIVSGSTNPLVGTHPSWERISLGKIADILNGFAFKSQLFSKERGMSLLRIRDVGRDQTDCRYDGPFEDRYVVHKGDLVIGMDGDFKCARWNGPDALLNQRVCRIELRTQDYDNRLLELAIPGYLAAIKERTSSVTVTHLSSRSVAEIPLPLPPLTEQKRIVARIEELLSRVNAARERLARVPAILKRFRQSVLAAACSGRLTVEWRASRHGAEDAEQSKELPSGWHQVDAGELYLDARYGTSSKCDREASGIPVLRVPNIAAGRLDLCDLKYGRLSGRELESLALAEGDLVVCRTNGSLDLVGKAALIPALARPHAFASYLIRLRANRARLLPSFLHTVLTSQIGREHIEERARTTAGQFNLNLEILRSLQVPLPPLGEQAEILRRMEALLNQADAIEQRVSSASARTQKLTQAILAKAFRGELVPTEAELSRREGRGYESGSELLDRIRGDSTLTPGRPAGARVI